MHHLSRGAVDGKCVQELALVCELHATDAPAAGTGETTARAAVLLHGRDDEQFTQGSQRAHRREQARRMDAVVVGDQDQRTPCHGTQA